ncbi:hypothetical protein LTR37_000240 [Vermiconidia calcicola]|uniref:Uncharacterized protein n=1 Tax=Vermiconidia calcicola TaxID=1690605 RepID=A0ACC3NZA6_9PEZI|nr:hypothetical protein LTR37_000240 [Vermiconidia calcicola]
MSFNEAIELEQEQPDSKTIKQEAYQLSANVARAWHHYQHLSMEYLRIPLKVRDYYHRVGYDAYEPSDDYPNKATEWRCKDAFAFETYDMALDERVEVVEGFQWGGPPILWKSFASQRAYHAQIRGLLGSDPLWAWEITKVANSEFKELHDALKVLQQDVDVLKNEWENWNGPYLEMEVDKSAAWTSITGRFLCAKLKFKDDGAEPHDGDPGYPALAYGIDGEEETAS